jgi:hypothetical protein
MRFGGALISGLLQITLDMNLEPHVELPAGLAELAGNAQVFF